MKFGVTLVRINPLAAPMLARTAEQLGYESVWIGDHLIWPAQIHSDYPYGPKGQASRLNPAVPTMDCWVLLATVAAATRTIRLGTNVYVLPLRDPFVTARSLVTLDVLSGGRVTFGVGAGWLREEFEALGLRFAQRGRRTDECMRVLDCLWSDETPTFDGDFFRFGPVKFEPKPVQRPGPPVLVGGHSDAALRRAAERSDGWLGIGLQGSELATTIGRLQKLRLASPRAGKPFDLTLLVTATPAVDEVDQYQQAGITRLIVSPFERTKDAAEGLERFAEAVF